MTFRVSVSGYFFRYPSAQRSLSLAEECATFLPSPFRGNPGLLARRLAVFRCLPVSGVGVGKYSRLFTLSQTSDNRVDPHTNHMEKLRGPFVTTSIALRKQRLQLFVSLF